MKKNYSHWQLDCTHVERTSLQSRQVLPTVHVWLQVNFGQMTWAARASCSALLCFLRGADVRKQRGLLWQWPRPPLVIAVPASERPPVALTLVLGADWELRSTGSCADRRVFHYWGGCGKSDFSMKHNCSRVQDEGKRAFVASCIYNITWVTRRWKSGDK